MPLKKKAKKMNEAELRYRISQAHRHFAWQIMVYLKAHPEILNANENQEVFDATREIQIKHRLKETPKYTREDAAEFVDFMCELEAKHEGVGYYVGQDEMDLYRPSVEHDEEWKSKFFITLMFYESGCYTKEVHDLVLAEEEAERQQMKNGNTKDEE